MRALRRDDVVAPIDRGSSRVVGSVGDPSVRDGGDGRAERRDRGGLGASAAAARPPLRRPRGTRDRHAGGRRRGRRRTAPARRRRAEDDAVPVAE